MRRTGVRRELTLAVIAVSLLAVAMIVYVTAVRLTAHLIVIIMTALTGTA